MSKDLIIEEFAQKAAKEKLEYVRNNLTKLVERIGEENPDGKMVKYHWFGHQVPMEFLKKYYGIEDIEVVHEHDDDEYCDCFDDTYISFGTEAKENRRKEKVQDKIYENEDNRKRLERQMEELEKELQELQEQLK